MQVLKVGKLITEIPLTGKRHWYPTCHYHVRCYALSNSSRFIMLLDISLYF
uniref:Uncharacterized protein n=1 Tax=Arundo donax TaxID=35708 RepID=A0A0A9H6H0_ARUDO